jgi:hypothetical protein
MVTLSQRQERSFLIQEEEVSFPGPEEMSFSNWVEEVSFLGPDLLGLPSAEHHKSKL